MDHEIDVANGNSGSDEQEHRPGYSVSEASDAILQQEAHLLMGSFNVK
jgi:hypothetical protein